MSTWTPNLNIQLIGTGEQNGSWGTTTNGNWQYCMENAIVGSTPIVFSDANKTLIASQSTTDQQYRYLYLNCSGTLTAQRTLFVPTINKNYIVINNTTGGYGIQVQTASGTGIVVPSGTTVPLYVDGTNVTAAYNYVPSLSLGSALPMSSGGTNNATTPTANSIVYTSTTTIGATTYPLMTYVPGNTSTTPFFLSSTGTGSAANAPTLTGSTGSGLVVLASQPTFSATQGNAPFTVNSTTLVANLNSASAAKVNNALVQGAGITFSAGTTYDGSQQVTISASGVTSVSGTSNQINASASTGAVQLSISSNYSAPSVVNALTAGSGLAFNSGTTYNGSAALTLSVTSAPSVTNSLTAGTGLSFSSGTTFNGSAAVTLNSTGSTLNSQSGAYVLLASDAGKTISISAGGITVNNSVFSAGNLVTIYNNSAGSQVITQGSGLTLQWAGQSTSTTGNRTLGLYGICTILFISSSSAVISGAGLT